MTSLHVFFFVFVSSSLLSGQNSGFRIIRDEAKKQVEVYYAGKLFTAYIYSENLDKPVLFPVNTPDGHPVTRGFPLSPRPGERVDHPHHVGFWFNYGEVNGLDFWNNSYAIPPSEKHKYGSIKHVEVLTTEAQPDRAVIEVRCNWIDSRGQVQLEEITHFLFETKGNSWKIFRTTILTASAPEVVFGDSKEGLCAIRVDRAFETPSDKPEVFTDASGKPTAIPVLNNQGVNGYYRSSEGLEKDAVWGTQARWVSLSAMQGETPVSIGLFDHPQNIGYPAFWHARGYGLFSVNNLGRNGYQPAKPKSEIVLKKGESLTFRHLLLIHSGSFVTDEEMEATHGDFSKRE